MSGMSFEEAVEFTRGLLCMTDGEMANAIYALDLRDERDGAMVKQAQRAMLDELDNAQLDRLVRAYSCAADWHLGKAAALSQYQRAGRAPKRSA